MLAGIIAGILLALFIGGWIYVWSPKRREEFDAAARLPLDDPQQPKAPRKRDDKEHSA